MGNVATAMAKLAGIRKAIGAVLEEKINVDRLGGRVRTSFAPGLVAYYFRHAKDLVDELRALLPDLYGDFQRLSVQPVQEMADKNPDGTPVLYFSRSQLEQLARNIDQIFEIRAHSELAEPAAAAHPTEAKRVFISHGRSKDWYEVQAYIERDIGLRTIELAQEPNAGRTVIEKLEESASACDSAVIVMTGDDIDADGQAKARENVMHEIGYFQAKYGRARVCLLHEEGVNIPTNLSGVVYVPFPKGIIGASFGALSRELKAIYKL